MRISSPATMPASIAVMALAMLPGVMPAPVQAQSSQAQSSQAQGSQRALDALGPGAAARKSPAHGHHAHHASHHDAARASHDPAPSPKTAAAAVAAAPAIPAAAPPPPVFKAPAVNVPLHPAPPPPPVPVVASAVGAVSGIDGGSRITFGDGSADLNPAGMQALQAFTARMKADPQARAQIDAYGRGTTDDPSTPRRIALSRGLAARAVLINGGIPSTRIYVRAIGQPSDSGPADRIDIISSDKTQPAPKQADAALGKVATTP